MSKINWRTVSDEEINTWPILGGVGSASFDSTPTTPRNASS